jgi:dGTP triphosphohydrolase
MKKLLLLVPTFFAAVALNAQTQTQSTDEQKDITKVIEFKELDHDFGKIPFGKPAEFELDMKNISSDTVKIENVQVGCGCTTPKWSAGPYAPGEDFKVGIGFNGATDGEFHKVVTIFFNGGLQQVIKFHGQTFKTPDNAAPANASIEKLKPNPNQ